MNESNRGGGEVRFVSSLMRARVELARVGNSIKIIRKAESYEKLSCDSPDGTRHFCQVFSVFSYLKFQVEH